MKDIKEEITNYIKKNQDEKVNILNYTIFLFKEKNSQEKIH